MTYELDPRINPGSAETLLGVPVYESPFVPPGRLYVFDADPLPPVVLVAPRSAWLVTRKPSRWRRIARWIRSRLRAG